MLSFRWLVPIAALIAGGCSSGQTEAIVRANDRVEVSSSRDEATSGALTSDEMERLRSLGYASTSPTLHPELRGVTSAAEEAYPGLNLHCSRRRRSALLTDMDGHVVHRWTGAPSESGPRSWMHVEPLRDGSILTIATDWSITKYDFESNVLWRHRTRAHHDLAIRPDGSVLALVRSRREIDHRGGRVPVLADAVQMLSPEGKPLRRIELLPVLSHLLSVRRLDRIAARLGDTPTDELVREGGVGDVLHTNSIELIHRDVPGIAPAGSVLLSFRALDRVAILSGDLSRVLWLWGKGELSGQHDAKQLEDGHLMIFDNGPHRHHSRVLEVDVASKQIVSSYQDESLFTRLRGGAQRLPNGNLLITESDSGHAYEVNGDGDKVWELWNPDVRIHGERAERGVIYRLNRFPESFFAPLVRERQSGPTQMTTAD